MAERQVGGPFEEVFHLLMLFGLDVRPCRRSCRRPTWRRRRSPFAMPKGELGQLAFDAPGFLLDRVRVTRFAEVRQRLGQVAGRWSPGEPNLGAVRKIRFHLGQDPRPPSPWFHDGLRKSRPDSRISKAWAL